MPPSRRSSSSRSSRSRSSSRSSSSRSRSSSSRRRSSSSHSSSYSSSYRSGSSSSFVSNSGRTRRNQPARIPSHIKTKALMMRCKNHDYMYVHESWTDERTGVLYRKGYYDEEGKYYDADSIAFKKPDGSYEAHYVCDYCGTELEANWKEGFYPTCKNCGAEMNKTPVYIDEIVNIGNLSAPAYTSGNIGNGSKIVKLLPMIVIWITVIVLINIFSVFRSLVTTSSFVQEDYSYESQEEEMESNLEIYGNEIYLDEVSPNIYRICSQQDEYEKHITWDYGAESYYDYDSDCYLWYNTDVSPNLWQYWYDDIAGDDYYGWMECEGNDWYIEVSDTEWEKYEGDTSWLWHIENSFD